MRGAACVSQGGGGGGGGANKKLGSVIQRYYLDGTLLEHVGQAEERVDLQHAPHCFRCASCV